jgi:hypothetical protein
VVTVVTVVTAVTVASGDQSATISSSLILWRFSKKIVSTTKYVLFGIVLTELNSTARALFLFFSIDKNRKKETKAVELRFVNCDSGGLPTDIGDSSDSGDSG